MSRKVGFEPNEISEVFENGEMKKDGDSLRIEWLIQHHLKWVSKDSSGWLSLYQDPDDGRYWELLYEDSDSQGGGPAVCSLPKERLQTTKEKQELCSGQ